MVCFESIIKIIEGLLQNSCLQMVFHKDSFSSKSYSYGSLQLSLLQLCDNCNYHKNTKFLAKTLFDLSATHLSNLNPDNANLYALSAFSIAVKFHESQETVEQLTLRDLSKMTDEHFSQTDFIQAESQILELIEFQLHVTSPYDYLSLLSSHTREESRQREIESLIDFAITLPKLTLVPPKLIFLACFLQVYDSVLSSTKRRLLRRQVRKHLKSNVAWSHWQKAEKMAGQMKKSIELLSKAGELTQEFD